ncbi:MULTISPECIES: FAD-binding oxidoreductase [unclassified Devosia]|uniref:NAD(P)/FAD-dependent oxidoreductase n=1 Tax=unclassified Devosia TaxID=196773 RepID=UPI00086CA0BA|nr:MULTISPECIES: FAD-binding oxidoreductase [unclassified Devosia]MBN9362878.1 FAD-binding oxidoreductase [Devosia sp.]ODS88430.1 MAG: amino acid dehydrogenase [Devosia sp. SCN 66-27]OJX23595.1 MAG: amino acid dehydrogenase [Devosia sp. 66-14]
MTEPTSIDVAIIGAGIIGVSTAFKLQEAGRTAVLIDRKGIAEETSRGNAGAFAFSDVIPMATSGVLGKLPRWLSDPLGPLTIRPEYLPQITPWLLRFWRAGWPDRVAASLKAQSAMMRLARTEADALIASAGLDEMIRRDGVLELYESEDELRKTARDDAAKSAEGIEFRHVRGAELAELQPGLSPRITCATFIPKWQTVSDPYDYAVAVGKAAMARGASFRRGEVAELRPDEAGVTVVFSDGNSLRARQVVVAGGAWSKRLTAPLGDAVPLETERGYNTTLDGYSFDLRRQLVFGGHGFVVTPLASGIRIGGAVELGGLSLPPNFKRADAMLTKAAAFMPGLVTSGGKQWMGFRPSLPDSLPAIGFSRRSRNIVYAFGHGHLGLTQSAATGKLVAELATGAAPSLDLTPFSPQRF